MRATNQRQCVSVLWLPGGSVRKATRAKFLLPRLSHTPVLCYYYFNIDRIVQGHLIMWSDECLSTAAAGAANGRSRVHYAMFQL